MSPLEAAAEQARDAAVTVRALVPQFQHDMNEVDKIREHLAPYERVTSPEIGGMLREMHKRRERIQELLTEVEIELRVLALVYAQAEGQR